MPGRHGKQRMKKRKSRRERPTEMEVTLKDSIHNRIRKEKAILAPMIPPTVPRYTAKIPTNTASLILAGAGKNAITGVSSGAQLLMPTFAAATTIRANANNAKRPTVASSTVQATAAQQSSTASTDTSKAAPSQSDVAAASPAPSPKGKSAKRPREEENATTDRPVEKARQVEGNGAVVATPQASTPNAKGAVAAEKDNAATSPSANSKSPKRNARKSKEASAADIASGASPKTTPIVIPHAPVAAAAVTTMATAVSSASPVNKSAVVSAANPVADAPTDTIIAASPTASTTQKRQRSRSNAKQQDLSVAATPMTVIPKKDDDDNAADESPVPVAIANSDANSVPAASPAASPKGRRSRKAATKAQDDTTEMALFPSGGQQQDDTANPRSTTMINVPSNGIGAAASPRPSIKATSIGSFHSTNSEEAAASPEGTTGNKKREKRSASRKAAAAAAANAVTDEAPAPAVPRGSALSSVKSFFSNVSSKLFSPTASSSAKAAPVAAATSATATNAKKRGGNSASPAATRDLLSPQNARKAATPSAKQAASSPAASVEKPRWR